MAAVSGKSALFGKQGNRLGQALKAHRDDPTEYGPMRLPPGITNGIAKLVECTFGTVAAGKQNAGETYWRAAGVVVEPKTVLHNGQEVPVQGQQTSIMEMLCDTQTKDGSKATSFDDHMANYLNEMRKLGGEDFTAGAETEDDLKALNEALKEAGPYFRFSTSAGKPSKDFPEPRTWENWHGTKGLENYVPPEDSGVDDRTGEAPAARPSANGDGEPDANLEFGDLDSLAERADAKPPDREARTTLKKMAAAAGIDDEAVGNADDWAAVAELIKEAGGAGAGGGKSEDTEPYVPRKGDVVTYRPLGKDKKPVRKAVECKVEAVDKKSETATLKNLEDRGTIYKDVPWDELTSVI